MARWQQWPSSFTQQKRTISFGRKSPAVIVQYIHLPKTYRDEDGLPFQKDNEELGMDQVIQVFGGLRMSPTRADRLLRILHGRRVAGTLDDPAFSDNTADYSQRDINQALAYLRKTVPVDEVINAGLRAEDELRQLGIAVDQEEQGEETTTATTTTTETKEKEDDGEKSAQDERRALYGESILDKIRASNRARQEAQEAAEAEQRRLEEMEAAQNWGGVAEYDPTLHRGLHPQQLAHYEAATSDLEAPPDVPRWRPLLPVTAFFVVTLGALYAVVHAVGPRPGQEVAAAGGVKDSRLAVGAVVLLNVLVFVAWKRVRLWKFLNKHWVLDFVAPRPHQLLTAMTTHLHADYLVRNSLWLLAGGTLFADEVGPLPFLATYVASGACAFIANLYWHVARGVHTYIMGASSATFGAVCAYFWLYRFDGFKVLGLPPDPYQGIQGLGIIGILATFFALAPIARGVNVAANAGHLVGMLAGMGCAALVEKPWKAAKEGRLLEEAGAGEEKREQGKAS